VTPMDLKYSRQDGSSIHRPRAGRTFSPTRNESVGATIDFISYVEEDGEFARKIAHELRELGLHTWTFEEDGVPGVSYLTQVHRAIGACGIFVLVASQKSVRAHQVIREVEQAHEREKVIVPIRLGITHGEFASAHPILRMASGTAVTLNADSQEAAQIARRIQAALKFEAVGSEPLLRGIKESDSLPPVGQTNHDESGNTISRKPDYANNLTQAQETTLGSRADSLREKPLYEHHAERKEPTWAWVLVLVGVLVQVILGSLVLFAGLDWLSTMNAGRQVGPSGNGWFIMWIVTSLIAVCSGLTVASLLFRRYRSGWLTIAKSATLACGIVSTSAMLATLLFVRYIDFSQVLIIGGPYVVGCGLIWIAIRAMRMSAGSRLSQ
jgi:hypothetical protein